MIKKHVYIAPTLLIVEVSSLHSILLTASENGNSVILDGGSAQDDGITSADVKGLNIYNVWDDDWSR